MIVVEPCVESGELLVATTHTQHSAGRWGYLLACNVGFDKQPHRARIGLDDLRDDGPGTPTVALYDWRRRRVEVLPADGAYEVDLETQGWDYRIAAPVLAGDIAVVGDPALYASAGDARIADVVVDRDEVVVTVLGAHERISLAGWSRTPISATVWSPATGAAEPVPTRDDGTGLWELAVTVGATGWAKVRIRHVPDAQEGVLDRS